MSCSKTGLEVSDISNPRGGYSDASKPHSGFSEDKCLTELVSKNITYKTIAERKQAGFLLPVKQFGDRVIMSVTCSVLNGGYFLTIEDRNSIDDWDLFAMTKFIAFNKYLDLWSLRDLCMKETGIKTVFGIREDKSVIIITQNLNMKEILEFGKPLCLIFRSDNERNLAVKFILNL
jgi:hypothetical protein